MNFLNNCSIGAKKQQHNIFPEKNLMKPLHGPKFVDSRDLGCSPSCARKQSKILTQRDNTAKK